MTTTGKPRPLAPSEIKPGYLLPVVQEEIAEFDENAQRFRDGDFESNAFRSWRLTRGVYGQRQPDNQMMRIKLCGGIVTSDQMDALGRIARDYTAINRGHITTRENIQFHFVPLERVPEVLQILADVGLTTREACSNVVRNVTGCPEAGVTDHEIFDSTPYLVAFARNMLRNPAAQTLPRKFKVAFSCGPRDCAGSLFHDLGFIPVIRDGVKGFEIRAGGGTATMAWPAHVVTEFARADDGEYLKIGEAAVRVFDREGDETNLLRRNKNMARMKFLVKKVGAERFNQLIQEELQKDWAKEPLDMATLSAMAPEGPVDYTPPADAGPAPAGFARWKYTNVQPQKQAGYFTAAVMVPIGNLTGEHFMTLAELMRRYSGGHARVNPNQNIVLRWIPEAALPHLYRDLKEFELGYAEAGLFGDPVSCPGATSCSLGITRSMEMGLELGEYLRDLAIDDPLIEQMSIKMSGCPNGCGHHHIASIGFQGAATTGAGGHAVPAYDVFLGGTNYIGASKYGERVGRVPAKRVPHTISRLIEVYQRDRQKDEPFDQFVARLGAKSFAPLLMEFQEVGPVHTDIDMYMDYGTDRLFIVERGEGECAI